MKSQNQINCQSFHMSSSKCSTILLSFSNLLFPDASFLVRLLLPLCKSEFQHQLFVPSPWSKRNDDCTRAPLKHLQNCILAPLHFPSSAHLWLRLPRSFFSIFLVTLARFSFPLLGPLLQTGVYQNLHMSMSRGVPSAFIISCVTGASSFLPVSLFQHAIYLIEY